MNKLLILAFITMGALSLVSCSNETTEATHADKTTKHKTEAAKKCGDKKAAKKCGDKKDAKKCGEGKCGDKKAAKKCGEGKCGDKKAAKKCGEGKCGDKKAAKKCGDSKCGDKKAAKKCGEGKCGDKKAAKKCGDSKCGDKKAAKKCGEGKCGDKKAAKKCGDSKCGDKKAAKKCGEGKCGAKKAVKKCGEGKCGAKKAAAGLVTAINYKKAEAKVLTKYPPLEIEMEAKKLAAHTYQVQGKAGIATDNGGFISNSGFVVTDEGVVVVDSLGSPPLAVELLKRIRKVTDKPVKKLIITHYHADHLFGAQVFKEIGAEIIAPIGSYKYINAESTPMRLNERRESLKPWVNEQTYVVKPDTIIKETTEFELGGQHFVINVVGAAHSDGDLTLLAKEDGVLFSGDIIFGGRVPFIGGGSTKKWVTTLAGMEKGLKLNLLVPGHGDASNNPAAAIKLTKGYLIFMREVMGNAVEEMEEFVDAYEDTNWSEYEDMPAFSNVNRLNANTVFLSMEEESVE